jgi:hypothetical protein
MRALTTGALALALLILAASPALAKKKAAKPGAVQTATATVTTTSQGQVGTAVATCPGKAKVVGGGFVLGILDEGFGNGPDMNNVLESRREGVKAWRVSALRDDRQASGGGPAGNPLPITAEAYCRKRAGKITEVSVTESWPYPGGPAPFSPSATCGAGRVAVGGGFALVNPAAIVAYSNFLTASRPLGGTGWNTVSSSGTGGPSATTSVYCQKLKKPLRQTAASAAMPPASNGSAVAAVDSPGCAGKRTAVSGGLELPPFTAGHGIALPVESRRSGKSWHVATAKQLAGPPGGQFTAIALCG